MFTFLIQLLTSINATAASFIISAFVLLVLSIILYPRKAKLAVWVLFLCALCLGVGFASIDTFIHLWDEQYHALVAKNLAESPLTPRLYPEAPLTYNHQIWVANHIWLHKPPLSLWQMALSIKLFGANYFAVRLPSILMHAILVFVIYRMGRVLYTERIGFIAAIVFTFLNYPLALLAGLHTAEHVDIAFMFYVTLSLWCWLEYHATKRLKWLLLMGLFSGGAVLTKWLVGLLAYAGAGLVLLIYKTYRNSFLHWKHLSMSIGVTALVVVPWHVYAFFAFPKEYAHEMAYNSKHFYSVVEQHGGDFFYYWDNLNELYGNGDFIQWLILLAVISIPFFTKNVIHAVFLLISIGTPYFFFTLAATKMMSFCVIVAPIIALVVVACIVGVVRKIPYLTELPYARILRGLTIIFVAILLLRPYQAMMNHKLDTKASLELRRVYEVSQAAIKDLLLEEDKMYALSDANFLPEEAILWMFYQHNVIAYNHSFSEEEQKHLLDEGYTIRKIEWKDNVPYLLGY